MSSTKTTLSPFAGFSKLNLAERLAKLIAMGALTLDDVDHLSNSVEASLVTMSEKFIENTIGCFPLPLAIAANFHIDGKDYVIPIAIEETSIVAAASRTAKWIREHGEITTEQVGSNIIGQMQIAKVKNFDKLNKIIEQEKSQLITQANQHIVPGIVARGGGVKDISVRKIARGDGFDMAVIHVYMDPCDAMGANLINQVCEFLKLPVEAHTQEKVTMCILSNLADCKLTRARVVIRNIDPELGNAIAEASIFAECDPYRAATSNKGVMNGMDGILIATGNDWRAVEAGVHAYAARSGKYSPVTRWCMQGNDLIGELEAPIIVGTCGGVTRLHPTAKIALRVLGIDQAEQLSRVIAAVGLVQNLGALRALVSEGIVAGHMKLHVKNLLLNAGANADEAIILESFLQRFLEEEGKVTLSDVKSILDKLRKGHLLDDPGVESAFGLYRAKHSVSLAEMERAIRNR